MTVKEFLQSLRKMDYQIDRKRDLVDKLESACTYKGVRINEIGGSGGSHDPHSHESAMARFIDAKDALEKTIEELCNRREQAMDMIDTISDANVLDIFYRRYFNYEKWENIAVDKGISFQWVHELHRKGLIELERRFGKNL